MKQLEEKLTNLLGGALIVVLLGASYIVNEVVQQGKHAYYHLTGKSHKKIWREDINHGTIFDHLYVYVRKNEGHELFP